MKIPGIKAVNEAFKAYSQNKADKTGALPKGSPGVSGGDSLQLSQSAKYMQEIECALRDLPEVREELVNSIKTGLRTGTYQPDARKIADGIMQERLLDKQI